MIRAVGVGAGGHARVVLDILRQTHSVEVIGLVDRDRALWGRLVDGVPVLGADDQLRELRQSGVTHSFIGVGSSGDLEPRMQAWRLALGEGFEPLDAIHPRATVASSAILGAGVTVMAGAVINPGVRIGCDVIINTTAVVEHDCELADHVHVATGARLAGTVTVGEGSHIGAGATVRQGIRIGRRVIIGAGAVVVKDVQDCCVVAGVPARVLRTVSQR